MFLKNSKRLSSEPFEDIDDGAVMSDYIRRLFDQARQHYKEGRSLLPEVQAFKEFIEQNPIVFTEFVSMLEGAIEPVRFPFFFQKRLRHF